ncbi:putative transposable element encoded protein [Trachipleistophora hominis]|uniref:Putative transposable element encoded protein n=1 Tax=Trachipleistophora hominis TaxID=72359 RepID=L7JS68_TRAHO|nr:putative transposable element encoded protein [Trachipleistophora hominis]
MECTINMVEQKLKERNIRNDKSKCKLIRETGKVETVMKLKKLITTNYQLTDEWRTFIKLRTRNFSSCTRLAKLGYIDNKYATECICCHKKNRKQSSTSCGCVRCGKTSERTILDD